MRLTRRLIQLGGLLVTLVGVFALRGNAERWCPFGAVEAAYSYAREGSFLCSLGISNFYILAGVLVGVLLLRRAFCGYLCPIGTISEWLRAGAERLGIRGFDVAGRADRALALLKYPVLGIILFFTWRTSELVFRGYDPCYALLSRHGDDITFWAYVISGALVLASLLIMLPFCRWLCPLAAVMNPLSRFGLARVKRDTNVCIDCGHCGTVCPAAIPVHQLVQVTVARCTSCMECVDSCPDAAALTWGPPDRIGRTWRRWVLVTVLLGSVGAAVAATVLMPLPSFVKSAGEVPPQTAVLHLRIEQLTCRGRATLLVGLLERDDMHELPAPAPGARAYYKLEAWPGPGAAEARIHYDPRFVTEAMLRQAITQPYYDLEQDRWWQPPFVIQGPPPSAGH